MEDPKQVIVIRKDLNMRKGKMCAQAAHASLKVILDFADRTMDKGEVVLKFKSHGPIADWLFNEKFKKICVSVDNEKDLDLIYENAKSAGIPASMIIDNGLTEFKGIFTKTCVAIGPAYSKHIDPITRHLQLL